ncbi:MAG: NIL domain-containing protein [Candidatus Omnitrophota bacterium]|nr:MAG: NIL domain-containing protein [Candidatus Omnitrophota bacterium]
MATREVELNIPGELKDTPLFYNIVKNFDVIPKILEASFSTEMGWAIITFEGREEELDKVFKYLEKNRVEVRFR